MADIQGLDLVLGAKVDGLVSGLDKAQAKLTGTKDAAEQVSTAMSKTSSSFDKTAQTSQKVSTALADTGNKAVSAAVAVDKVAKNLGEVGAKTAAATGGMQQVSKAIQDTSAALNPIPKQFEEVSASIDAIANSFSSKWDNIITGIEKANDAAKIAASGFTNLQNRVTQFGGGVLKFDSSGVNKVLADISGLTVAASQLPPVKLNFIISGDTKAALADFIGLSAEIRELATDGSASIAKLNSALSSLRVASETATDINAFNRYQVAIERVESELTRFRTVSANAATSVSGFNKSSNAATLATVNFGRVLQDLPFGFIGIANNLNPLLESFQRLQKETGSTKATLAALGSSLVGGGGLGLALSAVTALMTFAQVGLSLWSRGHSDASKKVKEHSKEIEHFVSDADRFDQELKKVLDSVSSESAKVNILFGALGNANVGLNTRKTLIDQLIQINPKYLGGLDKEKSSYEDISKAVNAYNDSLGKNAVIKSLLPNFDKIVKPLVNAQAELFKLQSGISPLKFFDEEGFKEEEARLQHEVDKHQKFVNQALKGFQFIAGGQLNLDEILFGKPDTTTGTKDKVDRIAEVLKNLRIAIDELKNDPLTLDLDKPLKEIDLIDNAIKRLRELGAKDEIIIKLRAEISDLALPAVGGQLEKKFGNLKNFELPDIDEPLRIVITKVEISNTIEDIQKKIDKDEKISRLKQSGITVFTTQHIKTSVDNLNDNEIDDNFSRLQDNIKNTADLLNQTLTPAFDSAFNAIANGKNVFQAVGDSIKQLVVKMIAAAAEAAVISLIVNAIFPGSGKTLSFGSIFSQISGLPKFTGLATGGIVPGGFPNDTFPALLSSGEAVIPLDKIRDFIQPQGSTQVFIPSLRVRGNDQVISFERAQNKRGRTY